MIFNPLFIDTETKQMNVFGSGKSQNSYLFRDIINIEKNLGEERKFFSSSVLTNLMNDVKGLFKNNTDQFSLSNEIESLLLSSSNFGEIENDLQELKDSQANENSIIVNNTIDNIVDFLKSTLDNLNDNFDVEIITENSEQMNYPGDLSYGDTLETIAAKLLNNEPILLSVENNNTSQFFELSLERLTRGLFLYQTRTIEKPIIRFHLNRLKRKSILNLREQIAATKYFYQKLIFIIAVLLLIIPKLIIQLHLINIKQLIYRSVKELFKLILLRT
jgi:hypothetical protein